MNIIPKGVYNILDGIWPIILIFVIVVSIVRLSSLYSHGKRIILYHEFISMVFVIYLLLLFELVTNSDMTSIGNNFTPFKEMFRYEITSNLFLTNVLGNVLLFVPFGLFVSYYIKNINFVKIFLITIITSFSIESIQTKIGRSFDVDDIILNVLGGIIGMIIYKILKKIRNSLPRIFRSETFLNIISLMITVLILILFINYAGIWRFF